MRYMIWEGQWISVRFSYLETWKNYTKIEEVMEFEPMVIANTLDGGYPTPRKTPWTKY